CGPSGSGKSSLAMETIYAEGQRRYVESLSSYARQFVSQMQKPHVEHIEGLSPAIALEQQNLGHSPRSTVGTVTEVYDYLRILLARGGTPYCPSCDIQVGTQSSDEIIEKVVREPAGTQLFLMAPVTAEVGQDYATIWEQLRSDGYMRMRVDGQTHLLESPPSIDRRRKHEVDVIVDRVTIQPDNRSRVAESIEAALALGRGVLRIAFVDKNVPEDDWRVAVHSQHLACDQCGRSFETLSPHHFSFNSQLGWCPACDGLGTQLGANPAILLKGNRFTLAEGALALWPNLSHDVARWMLHALGNSTGIPLDTPFEELSSRQRRLLLLGTGERWIDVLGPSRGKGEGPVLFRFQFKGVYPAIEEASRLAPSLRTKLGDLVDNVDCMACGGSRLRDDAAAMRYRDLTIEQLCRLPLGKLQAVVDGWKLNAREQRIAGELVREIKSRVKFLNDVGLDYLTLARPAATLSGGEAQRIRLASQLGSGLCGVLYVLDEPTIGLHPRDNTRLIGALHGLRDLGNTLLVVEHDREVIESSDHVIDFGPAAGKHGGQVVASGTATQLKRKRSSVTGPFLTGKDGIPMPKNRRPVYSAKDTPLTDFLEIRGAGQHNLKNVDAKIPLGTLTAITGPSGSGKSSLIDDILYNALSRKLHRTRAIAGAHEAILGIEHVNKVIQVDQKPLGYSPSSNPATYTGAFNLIRDLFAQLPDAKVRGYAPRRFSFNVPGGRCETCEGNGQLRIEMHFLPDVWVPCSTCNGQRYNPETLAVKYRGHSIADVLSMTCGEALQLLKNFPKLRRILQTLCDVGLDYISLGQPAPTLSGGEAQRVKLAAELSRPDTGRTLYLLDEPTTGLHFSDLVKLLEVLQRLVDVGNTVVVIEHNLDIIKSVDWIIDMGPEAGEDGGRIVAQGTPEQLVAHAKLTHRAGTANGKQTKAKRTSRKKTEPSAQPGTLLRSHTGEALIPVLEESKYVQRELFDPATLNEQQDGDLEIEDVGRQTQMPWEIDGRQWHVHDRVGRQGEPCRWEGKILSQIVDKVQELGDFSDTNWNARSVVEISSSKKSDGWFMHALTSDTWLLKLKFRVARNTFRREQLQNTLDLKTLNQLQELPIYGNEPRVKCKNLRGPWQEIELRLHTWHEIDRPEFWKFLESAVEGFQKHTERAAARPDDISPWKKLGEKWHFSRKGFPLGKPPKWDTEVLEELCEVLRDVSSDIGGEFLWNNQQLVHFYLKGDREPWASIVTKRPLHVELMLHGRKDQVALGRILGLGCERELSVSDPQRDVVKLRFRTVDDLSRGDLPAFLKEHATLRRSGS
ncbi:MAG: excinuclease ABC subunit UvrA, partial [Planctomycetales bacterium]|nr:excinuclease ABC subunit UvrA [Planctomycetales bacterium]